MDYTKNYVLTDEQVQNLIKNKIINPFVPKGADGMTPIYVLKHEDIKLIGEGGLGSGKKLKLSEEEKKARRKEQLKNAQRVYREGHREDYNKKQNEYYYAMKEDDDKYTNWKNKMMAININYRAKRKLQSGQKKIIKDIEKKLKQEWKEKNKGKAGRPKKGVGKEKKDMDMIWFEAEKQKRVQAELKKLGDEYVIPKQKTDKFDTEGRPVYKKFESDLVKDPVYPYTGDVGKGDKEPYTEADYIEYKATKLIPQHLKKEIKKKKKEKENIEMTLEEVKPVKEKKEKEEPIIYANKRYSDLDESERKAYDYISEKNIGQTGTNVIPYSKIPQIIKIRNY
jgi:hypothetical protein